MITKKEIIHEVKGDDFMTITSKVNKNKLSKLYGMLSNIYRNPIGSIVREYTSNAYDANVEAYNFSKLSYDELSEKYPWIVDEKLEELNLSEEKVNRLKLNLSKATGNDPVIIGIDYSSNVCFYIKDYGIGLSPERMQYVFFNYLNSTKENTDDEIGGFGIGAKSALSYTHTFFITTVYDGVQYKYIMTKNAEGIPEGQLLSSFEDDSLDNGTLIEIPLKDNDASLFKNEIKKQLCYIPNVVFKNIAADPYSFNEDEFNENKIFNFKDFKVAKNSPVTGTHICLGNITYTIDWSELNMNPQSTKIALKFKTGELQPTPSRESILYTKESIKLIKDKIESVNQTLNEMLQKEFQPTDDFKHYLKLCNQNKNVINIGDFDLAVNLPTSIEFGYKPILSIPELKHFSHNIKHKLFDEYRVVKRTDFSSGKSSTPYKPAVSLFEQNHSFFQLKDLDNVRSKKNYYILETKTKDDFYLLKYNKNDSSLINRLNINNLTNKLEIIKKFRKIASDIVLKYSEGVYEDVLVNPNWHLDYNSGHSKYSPKRTYVKTKDTELYCKIFSNDFLTSKRYLTEVYKKFKGKIIYTEHDNINRLKEFQRIFVNNKTVGVASNLDITSKRNHYIFITVSKTTSKKLKDMSNTIDLDDEQFMKLKPVIKFITCYKIYKELLLMSNLKEFNGINDDISSRYINLNSSVLTVVNNNRSFRNLDINLQKSFLEIVKIKEFRDHKLMTEFNYLKEYYKDIEFVEHYIMNSQSKERLIILLKKLKKRVNLEHYQKNTSQLLASELQKI